MVLGAAAVIALGVGGVFAARPHVEAASNPADPVSELAGDAGPVAAASDAPSVSDDGSVVVFVAADEADGSDQHVVVRDRVVGSTSVVAESPSLAPAVSGDGCVVVYSVPLSAPNHGQVQLTAVDRCITPDAGPLEEVLPAEESLAAEPIVAELGPAVLAAGSAVDTIDSTGTFAVPAVSEDGSVIAWSVGSEIRRYVQTGVDYALAQSFDSAVDSAVVASESVVTGADVDISADGNTVAFVAGPGSDPYAPTPANVYVWSQPGEGLAATIELASMTPVGTPGAADSLAPTISADGSLVLFESASQDLAATGGATTPTPFIVMLDRGNGTRVLADAARRPAISADAHHMAYERGGSIRLMTWVSEPTPYAVVTDEAVTDPVAAGGAGESSTGAVVSRFGRWVVFDSDAGEALTDDTRFHTGSQVWAADQRPSEDGTIPDQTTTTTTTTTSTTTTVADSTSTTTTTVGGGINGPAVTVPGDGVEAPVATTQPPQTTVPLGTLPPPTTFPFFTSSSSNSVFTSSSSSSSSGSVLVPDPPPVFDPVSIEFAPTIINAGRRTATITLSNPTSDTINLRTISIEPAVEGPFSVLSDTCSNTQLPVGGGCMVEVQFAPTAIGAASGLLTMEISDGSVVTASLSGEGSAEPTLDVVPEVAAVGQVVTVFGAGFPADSTVEFSWEVVAGSEPVVVDPDGTFAHVVVILPNTSIGPVTVEVAGQPDVFNDVSGELLISGSGGSSTAVLRDGVSRPYGR